MAAGLRGRATIIRSASIRSDARRRRIGQTDLHVFPLALDGDVVEWSADSELANGVLDAYFEEGCNFVDTSDSSAGGRSETVIGNWMRDRGNRSKVIVGTKIGKSEENPGVSAPALRRAVDASLQRLGTDYIDLLYLHVDDDDVAFDDTLLTVDDLIRSGKVRQFGASDHSADRLIEARVLAAQLGVTPMRAVQVDYSLADRADFEGNPARVASLQQLAVVPRFALAGGFLTGGFRSKADLLRSGRSADIGRHLNKRGLRILIALDRIAADHDASVATIALAWLLSKPNVVAPIVSVTAAAQLRELVDATRIQLGRHQLAELDRASA